MYFDSMNFGFKCGAVRKISHRYRAFSFEVIDSSEVDKKGKD